MLLQNRLLASTHAKIGNRSVTKDQTKKQTVEKRNQLETEFWELIGL